MLTKLNIQKLVITILVSFIFLFAISYFSYRQYQKDSFRRAYENESTYRQLVVLMGTTEYAEEIQKAGYQVDHYGLKMNQRIDKLITKTTPPVVVSVPIGEGVAVSIDLAGEDTVQLNFDKSMEVKTILHYKDGNYLFGTEISKTTQEKYSDIAKKSIEDTLKIIYDETYKK